MHDTPDSELLAAFRDGDREAFAVLVARHQGLVRSACLRQAPSGELEDCIQAVFLVLARRPASATQAPALAAWLLRVSWYVCRSAQRGMRRRRQAEGEAAQASGRHGSIRPEALDHLDDCLAKLPERQRVAVSMQYLAERPADEVAAALGVNRDNAYQLVSRGLATLRSLLARRGIALSSPALLALLAGEAQAATTSADATTSIALSLSTTPSANAASLATGASTAMTLSAPSTITLMAASLLLAAGVATAVVTAEPVQIPTAGPVQPIQVPAMDEDLDKGKGNRREKQRQPSPMQMALFQEHTLDFQNTSLVDTIAFLQRASNLKFSIDPQVAAAPHAVTLKVSKMQLWNVLAHIGRLTDTKYTIRDSRRGLIENPELGVLGDTYFIQAADPVQPPRLAAGIDIHEADDALHAKMQQRISFDFQDTPLTDVVDYFRQIDSENYVVMPAVATGTSTVTLKVTEMPMQDAWNRLCLTTGTSLRYVDQALLFDTASPNEADPDLPPPVRPVNATTF